VKSYFRDVFGNEPFDFQIRVADNLLNGNSVILRAPTGAGKTAAATFPYLYARAKGVNFPRQMIYSLPLRTLATSLYNDTLISCENAFLNDSSRPKISIQTGEQAQDPQFIKGDIVFCTYDQSLSSFLTIPVGLSAREANVNAGAIASSYLVFDEFHLMESDRAMTTMTVMLKWLREWTTFLLMTATLSETLVRRLGDVLQVEIVTLTSTELSGIPSQREKKRTFHVVQSELVAKHVVDSHVNRSIAVCNTVERAQHLFEQTADLARKSRLDASVVLLHSRFLPNDRRLIEENIVVWFGKNAAHRRNAILIATQAIEVGLDVTCEHLHTEIAPAAAIVQRAGRCARFPGESGEVHIYDAPKDDHGTRDYLPYDTKGTPPVCDATWSALQSRRINRCLVGFRREQALIRLVYNRFDQAALADESLNSRRNEVAGPNGVLNTLDRGNYKDLVRFVNTRSFIVHPDPDTIENPLQFQTFNVSPGTLLRWSKKFGPYIDMDWFARIVVMNKRGTNNDDERAQRYFPPSYSYECVIRDQQFFDEYFFVIHPQFVDYSPTIGLRFKRGGNAPDMLLKPDRRRRGCNRSYELETYEDHITRVCNAYDQVFAEKGRFEYASEHLARVFGVDFTLLVRATIASHDVGKLADDWQNWVSVWQRGYKHEVHNPDLFYAHTDYDELADKKKQASLNSRLPRPPHASEGAEAMLDVLRKMFPDALAQAAYTSVVRHHSPGADKVRPYQIGQRAQVEAARVFALVTGVASTTLWQPLIEQGAQSVVEQHIAGALTRPNGANMDEFIVYMLLIRGLRISDQQSLGPDMRKGV